MVSGAVDFSRLGYQFFPRLLDQSTVTEARVEVERLCDLARQKKLEDAFPLAHLQPHRNPDVSPEEMGAEPFLIPALPKFSEVFTNLLRQPNIWAVAEEVLQTKDVVYHFSNITRKPARIGPNMSWHRDYPNQYLCTEKADDFFRLLIPLEGMDQENGCTLALPGTHLVSDEVARQEEKRRDFDTTTAHPLIAQAGDGYAIHSKVVHGGAENRSTRDRNLIVFQFSARTSQFLYWSEEKFTGLTREQITAQTQPV